MENHHLQLLNRYEQNVPFSIAVPLATSRASRSEVGCTASLVELLLSENQLSHWAKLGKAADLARICAGFEVESQENAELN